MSQPTEPAHPMSTVSERLADRTGSPSSRLGEASTTRAGWFLGVLRGDDGRAVRMRRGVDLALRLVLAGVFFSASIQKARDPSEFAEQIANYQLLSEWSSYGAALLPSVELVAAATVLLGPRRWHRSATAVLVGLLFVFTAAIVQAWWRGINTECGCFGQGSTPIGIWTVLRNSALLAIAFLSLWLSAAKKGASSS